MKRRIVVFAVIAAAALVPLVVRSPYYLHILILAMWYIMMTEGLNLITGYVGLLSIGHIAFVGLGAYTSALVSLHAGLPVFVCMLIAGIFSAFMSFLIGKITFRVRGSYFVIMTSAFNEIIKLVINNSHDVTNGPMGIRDVKPASLFGFEIKSKEAVYYLGLVLVIITVYTCWRVIDSRIGRAFKGLREQENIANAVGISFSKYAMYATIIGGFFAGVAGAYYVHYTHFISPDVFNWSYTTTMLLMLVIGGKGTIIGPIIGSLIFSFLPELLRAYDNYRLPIYGLVLIVATILFPNGLISLTGYIKTFFKKRRMIPTEEKAQQV